LKKSGPETITTGWIPNKLDSGIQWLDSGFHELDSGFQRRGFRIPQAKIAWIPDSGFRITLHGAISSSPDIFAEECDNLKVIFFNSPFLRNGLLHACLHARL